MIFGISFIYSRNTAILSLKFFVIGKVPKSEPVYPLLHRQKLIPYIHRIRKTKIIPVNTSVTHAIEADVQTASHSDANSIGIGGNIFPRFPVYYYRPDNDARMTEALVFKLAKTISL